jgi:hypothetical protein
MIKIGNNMVTKLPLIINCPICNGRMESTQEYKYFKYICKSFCQYYGEYEQPILKLDENYNCYHYFIPFFIKYKLYYLTAASKNFTDDHYTIIIANHNNKTLISVPFIPIDIENTKVSSNQIINRLIKLLPFS